MKLRIPGIFLVVALVALGFTSLSAAPLQPGDVIALTGGSNIERTRFNGYLHTQLSAADPALQLKVRNYGWEGDTVFEQWRDTEGEMWRRPREWEQLLDDVGATVVFAQFGQMECLGGAAQLDHFVAEYEKLMDRLAAGKRRVILLSLLPFEQAASADQPDLTLRNDDVQLYSKAIAKLAAKRGWTYVDVLTPLSKRKAGAPKLTDNGYQLNDLGHKVVAGLIARKLGLTPKPWGQVETVRAAVKEYERLWFNYWRPMNWSFLAGDRTHVPFSRDWRDPEKRIFPEEMQAYIPLIKQAEANIDLALAGKATVPLTVAKVIPEMPPTIRPQSPDEEKASLNIDPNFQMNLFASEADGVMNPIQIRWDEKGRLWVACTVSYPQIKPGESANDKLIICEDTDGDGHADKFDTWVDGLFMPTGFELGNGGVYIAQGTELIHVKDTDGDGKGDLREVVLGGFGTADSHQMINCLSWGFGGELWFTQGHHIYSRVETPFGVETLNRAGVWRYRPRTMRLDPFFQFSSAGQNDWGVMTMPYGQVFHKSGATIGGYYSTPGLIRSMLDLSAEPMRLFKARAKHVGTELIESSHFPKEMQGQVLVAGYYDNTFQHYELQYKDATYTSPQLPHIIETTNTVFRPVDIRMGPDGAIYFADWYNPIIGHYQASYRDPNRDHEHGRIWRLTYKGRDLVKAPKLTGMSNAELLPLMGSPERWVKYQVKRLLFDAKTSDLIPVLDKWVATLKPGGEKDEYLRLQALGIYEGHETVRPELLKALLRSPDFRVRAYATRVVGNWQARLENPLALLGPQITDEHPRVRLEAVVASSYVNDPRAVTLATRALEMPMDPYLDHALIKAVNVLKPLWLDGVEEGTLKFNRDDEFLYVMRQEPPANAPAMLRERAGKLGAGDAVRPYLAALAAVGDADDVRWAFDRGLMDASLLDSLGEETRLRRVVPSGDLQAPLAKLLAGRDAALQSAAIRLAGTWQVAGLADAIRAVVLNHEAPMAQRLAALDTVGSLQGKGASGMFMDLMQGETGGELKQAALATLARVDMPQAAKFVSGKLGQASQVSEAADVLAPLLRRTNGAGVLAQQLGDGSLSPAHARRALAALGSLGRGDKPLIDRLSALAGVQAGGAEFDSARVQQVAAAAKSSGRADEGRKVFEMMNCMACHKVNGEGGIIGPELSVVARGLPLEGIITEVLWPQLNVKEGFTSVSVRTKDGRLVEGIKVSERADEVQVRDLLGGEITRIGRGEIAQMRDGGSAMPDGMTAILNDQQLADLIKYLSGLGLN